jgi:hypothetical protein
VLLLLSWGWSKALTRNPSHDYKQSLSFDALCHGIVTLFLIFLFLLRYDVRLDLTFPFQWKFILIGLGLLFAAKLLQVFYPPDRSQPQPTPANPSHLFLNPYLRWSLLVVLILTGFALRLRDVRRDALVPDEITQALQSLGVLERGYPSLAISDAIGERPVLASALLAYVEAGSFALFGRNEFAARLPQVLFGTLMILLIYRVGREMFDERVGLFAAFLYTFSSWAVAFSQLARYPQMLQLATLLAVYFLHQALKSERVTARSAMGFAVSVLACYFTWEASVLMLVPLFVAALYLRGAQWQWLKERTTWASLGVIALVIVVYRLRRMMVNPFVYVVGTNLGQISLGFQAGQPRFDWLVYWNSFLLLENQLVLTATAGVGWLLARRDKVITFLAIFLLGGLILKTLLLPVAAVRYTYELLPFLLLIVSAVIFRVKDEYPSIGATPLLRGAASALTVSALALVSLTSAAFPLMLYNLPGGHHPAVVRLGVYRDVDFQRACDALKSRAAPRDVIVATQPQAIHFFYGRCDYFPETLLRISLIYSERLRQPVHRIVGCPVINSLDQLKETLARNSRVWFIVKEDRLEDLCDEQFVNYFLRMTRCVYEHRGAKIYLWER